MKEQWDFHASLAAGDIDNESLDRVLFPFAGQEDDHPMHTQ